MIPIVIVGSGKIGRAIAHLLTLSGDYRVTVVDRDLESLSRLAADGVATEPVDAADIGALRHVFEAHEAVCNAAPHQLNAAIATAAAETRRAYFDLTEDVTSTRMVKALAAGAGGAVFVPQCGLAPGFVSIAAAELTRHFDSLRAVRMRVGALPVFPHNGLAYNLTWSIDGLINEYLNPCEAIHDGELVEVLPLEERETFSWDGVTYEAFNTSGGLGTLAETLAGRVETLNYKTVRYPGHCDLIKLLAHDLRLGRRREVFRDVLEHAVPVTFQDVVLVFVTVSGLRKGELVQETFARKIYGREVGGKFLSAIQLTTASGICAMIDLWRERALPHAGFVRQEEVRLPAFLANRFGRHYGDGLAGA